MKTPTLFIFLLSITFSFGQLHITPEKLDVSKTLNDSVLTDINSLEEVIDFDALKKDPSSEIKRLDIEIKNQEEKITSLKDKLNQSLITPYNELKSSLDKLNNRIQKLNDLLSDKNGLKASIDAYNLSEIDLDHYNTLESQQLYTNDVDDKKSTAFIEKLRKSYYIENQILFTENRIYEYNKGDRITSLKLIEINEKDLKKYKKLQSSQNFNVVEEQENAIKKLTGIDLKYFDYKSELLRIEEQYSSTYEEYLLLDNHYNDLKESYSIVFNEKRDKLKLVNEYKHELIKSKRAYIAKEQYLIAKKKYPTVQCGETMISKVFLNEKVFRTGEPIKKARTTSEWEKFDKSNTPCYAYKDFNDENNSIVYYNIHALTDSRKIAPYGYKILEFRDISNGAKSIYRLLSSWNDLIYESHFDYSDLRLLDYSYEKTYQCDRKQEEFIWCNKCSVWTDLQRKYNICTKCNGRRSYSTGRYITCQLCNGKGSFKDKESPNEVFVPLLKSRNELGFELGSDKYVLLLSTDGYSDYPVTIYKRLYNSNDYSVDLNDIRPVTDAGFSGSSLNQNEMMFPILICEEKYKNKNNLPPPNNQDLSIGGVEFMPKLLDVVIFNNGDPIKLIEDPVEWEIAIRDGIPAYCYFDNDSSNRGCIYNQHAFHDVRGIIPNGWRLPEYWDEDYYKAGYEGYYPLNKLTIPRVNFNNYPKLFPHGIRTDEGEFISSQRYSDYGVWKGDWGKKKVIVPQLNFYTRLRDDKLGGFYFDDLEYQYSPSKDIPFPKSGYVLLVRDVRE